MVAVRNRYLSEGTARDIDAQVAKVLRNLGNPEPPIRLEQVQELLNLDHQFYTQTDSGIFRETYSRIRVGAIQVFKRPELLAEAIRKLSLKALYVPDQKRILIDSELPPAKIRWATAHEITHELCIEWHQDVLFGDSDQTISESCHQQIEHEANYGAGRLLTLQDTFIEEVRGLHFNLNDVSKLAKRYGNTWSSTLWRSVESTDTCSFAVIGSHPKHQCTGDRIRYFIRSREFERQFGNFDEVQALDAMKTYCSWSTKGNVGKSDSVLIQDAIGDEHIFSMETFATPYDVMTVGHCLGKKPSSFSASH